jgi:hypothetical protein
MPGPPGQNPNVDSMAIQQLQNVLGRGVQGQNPLGDLGATVAGAGGGQPGETPGQIQRRLTGVPAGFRQDVNLGAQEPESPLAMLWHRLTGALQPGGMFGGPLEQQEPAGAQDAGAVQVPALYDRARQKNY